MKRSYSKLNLLQETMTGVTEVKGFFQSMFTGRKHITLEINYYDYLRGKIVCEDIMDNYKEEVPFHFDISLLIYILYNDFLNQIKRGAKNSEIANYLVNGKNKHFKKTVREKRVLKPLSKYMYEFESVEEEVIEESNAEKDKMAYISIRMKDSELLRAEVLLHDLTEYYTDGEVISVEQMIAIVFLDFIEAVKKEGNSMKVQKSILAHLKRF